MLLTTRGATTTAVLFVLLTSCGGPGGGGGPQWPVYTPDSRWKPLVDNALADYVAQGTSYLPRLENHTPLGDFMNFGVFMSFVDPTIQFDADGLPMVYYDSDRQFHYNPATIGIYGLWAYGASIHGENTAHIFPKAADKLIAMQSADGAFRYEFPYYYFRSGRTLPAGWVSCLPQAFALALFARMYDSTGDSKYLNAGDKALNFLLTPVGKGGVMDSMKTLNSSLAGFIFFDEFNEQPPAFTLDDFMYALLGLYDWSNVPGARQADAKLYFDRGLETLKQVLPYYEVGGFSSYDMGHITHKANPQLLGDTHAFHIAQLHALHSITNEPILKQYETLWASYVPR